LERQLVVVEYILSTPSGDDQFEARLVPLLEDEVVVIVRNITGRRRAELALEASEGRLRASQKMEALGRLAGGVAHDFNNLLSVIVGRLELQLRDRAISSASESHAREALAAAGQASSLTRQLLALSRRQVLEPQVLDLNGVVADMQAVLGRLIGEHIAFVVSLGDALGVVRIDRSQLEQVVLNLAVNARDAMPNGGTLTLSTRREEVSEDQARDRDGAQAGPYLVLEVTDTGCGMTPEVMAHLFEPFFTTKPRGQGTGLGLATVYGIVKQSGAHLVVRSAPDKGSTFELFLPEVDEMAALSLPRGSAELARAPEGERNTILVVEDEERLLTLTAEILEDAGYAVLCARHGDDALRAIALHPTPIDLLLTDIVMPGMDGRALARRVTELHPAVRVVLMSGHDDSAGDAPSASSPILEKPFNLETLLTRVRDALAARVLARR
jgi:signal transduction histidine kinase/CheY-like chemotaxis protein